MSTRAKRKKDLQGEKPIRKEDTNLLFNFDIKTISTTKIIEVIFFIGKNEQSNNLLFNLKPISTKFENVSNATIVTYQDVLAILEEFPTVGIPDNIENELKFILQNRKSFLDKGNTFTPEMIAEILKIKLIHLLYQHNKAANDRKLRIKAFDEELHQLTKDCRVTERVKHDKWSSRQSGSKLNVPEVVTSKQPLSKLSIVEENKKSKFKFENNDNPNNTESIEDIVFDDDISKHIWFYIFYGFEDVQIIKYLTNNLNIIIRAIVQIDLSYLEKENNSEDKLTKFWTELLDILYSFKRQVSLENTILMNYHQTDGLDFEDIYQELIQVLRTLWNIKLKHLHYIRNTQLVEIRGTYPSLPVECLNVYKKLIHVLPNELISESVVLSSLLQEIESHYNDRLIANKFSLTEVISSNLNGNKDIMINDNCVNPLILADIINRKQISSTQILTKSLSNKKHLIYDGNILELILITYNKDVGNLVSNLTLDLWKKIYPFNFMNTFMETEDIIHTHDRDPSAPAALVDIEKMRHFMYIFLFGLFTKPTKSLNDILAKFIENLDFHCEQTLWKQSQVSSSVPQKVETVATENFYKPPLASYVWSEKLSSDVLIQDIVEAQDDYRYGQIKYCPESDKYMVSFSDYLDEFGVNVKVFDELLYTPVCLRDFCKYIIAKKDDWLSEHAPPKYFRKGEQFDCFSNTKNLSFVNVDYRYLLSSKLTTEDTLINEIPEETETFVSFNELLKDLNNYPINQKLDKECGKIPNTDDMNVFDVGSQFIAIMGAVTTFVSHDGVKLTVDNTKFTDEERKCSIRLTCLKHDIIVHSDSFFQKNNFDFHVNLNDGTILTFFLKDCIEKHAVDAANVLEKTESIKEISITETVNKLMDNLNSTVILPISENILSEKFNLSPTVRIPNLDIATVIKNLDDPKNTEFYKIIDNVKYISAAQPNVEIPLINLMDRLIPSKNNNTAIIQENQKSYSKRHISKSSKRSKSIEPILDFRISLPNGLYLSCIPALDNNSFIDIKQEYLDPNRVDDLFEEEFRLFSRNACVLIKKVDGTIMILKASGEQLVFEKPDTTDEVIKQSSLKRCHCKNLDDYRKKLIHIMNKRTNDSAYSSSRKGGIHTKKGYIIDQNAVDMLNDFKIPYKKMSVIKFSGHRTCLEGNKITQKQIYFHTYEHDFSSQEMYFERSDGLKNIFDKNGRHSVEFSDGTVITSEAYFKRELVDGFVYISHILRYEHPQYITVGYKCDNSLNVHLNNDVKLTKSQGNNYTLTMGADIETNFDMKTILFKKNCKNCSKQYNCKFNIEPLINKKIKPSDRFVHVKDSYEKKFFVDFAGNCERDNNFINRFTNNVACNHVFNNTYRKLFVMDKNLTGEQFWSQSMVEREKAKMNVQVNEGCTFKGNTVLNFTKKHFTKYGTRFRNNSSGNNVKLSRYNQNIEPAVEYLTYRVLQKMIDPNEIETTAKELQNLIKANSNVWTCLECVVVSSLEDCDRLKRINSILQNSREDSDKELKKTCQCIALTRTAQDKIFLWREELKKYKEMVRVRNIPSYFESQFCQRKED